MNEIPIHVDQHFHKLYVSYIDGDGEKKYKQVNHEYEMFVSNKNEPIIDIADSSRLTFKTFKERKELEGEAAKQGYATYLADVSFSHQYYLSEYGHLKELPHHSPNIAFIDIEAHITGKFTIDGSYPVTAITVGMMKPKHRLVTFAFHPDLTENKIDTDRGLFYFTSEAPMLSAFIQFMRKNKFDLMTGWNFCSGENGSGFDNPYLINRLIKYDMEKKLSPFGIVKKKYRYDDYDVYGLPSLDYLSLYKKFQFKELPSYRLDYVAETEGIAKKIEFEGTLNSLYENDFETYVEYNRRDVQIMLDLEAKRQYFDLIGEIRKMAFVNLNTINNSALIDNILIKTLREQNKVARTKKYKSGAGIPGAYVKQPEPGIYDWVVDLDYTSLYPFIIMNLNISPDTKVGQITNWDDIQMYVPSLTNDPLDSINKIDPSKSIRVKLTSGNSGVFTYDNFMKLVKLKNLTVSNFGTLFTKDDQGTFPYILDWLFKQRNVYKKKKIEANKVGDEVNKNLYHSKQLAFKILLNSFYGFTAFPGSRFFDKELGSSITMTGRKLIRYAIQEATRQNYIVITTDTDSILFTKQGGFDSAKDAISHGAALSKSIDSQLVDWCREEFNVSNSTFNIKQEIVARRGSFFAKKRYSLWKINEEGATVDEIEYKGVEIVRNSTPPIIKDWLVEIFETSLKQPVEESKKIVPALIAGYRKQLRDVDIKDIGIRTSMTKDIYDGYQDTLPVHVRGALVYEAISSDTASFDNEIKGRYYFLRDDAPILDPIRTDEELAKLLLNDNNKKCVISIPESSTMVISPDHVDYDTMEDRLLNNPLKHLILIYDELALDDLVANMSAPDKMAAVYEYMQDRFNIPVTKQTVKRFANKALKDKYYNMYLVVRILEKLNCTVDEFQEYLKGHLPPEDDSNKKKKQKRKKDDTK